MRSRSGIWLLFIVVLALAIRVLTAWLIEQPGYTDAYYYALGARQLYAGHGFEMPFIWNYLNPPEQVVHPGYLYWMPLSAILGWLGKLLGGDSFRAIQAPFVLLSALLPLIAYRVARDLAPEPGKRRYAVLAALLATFPGFYAHVFVLPDNFAPYAIAGALSLWAAGRGLRGDGAPWFGLAGLAAGFGHLSRADGLLLAGVVLVAAAAQGFLPAPGGKRRQSVRGILLALVGYLLVMAPWFVRNWRVTGTPLPTGGTQTLFLTTYDDVFAYGRPLTLESYLAWGWGPILASKIEALAQNALRLWVENLMIILLPFSALGLWRLRRDRLLWPFLLYFPLLFLAMTFAFTFPGPRGGLYHSGAALLPFFFAAAGPGLDVSVRWAARRLQGWHAHRAWQIFAGGLVAIAILVTVFALWEAGAFDGEWNQRDACYESVDQWLARQGVGEAIVMVGNAPGFTWHTGHPAVAVPNESLETVLAVADHYGAQFLLLDTKRPRTTDDLYAREIDHPRLERAYEHGECQVYGILP